MKNQLQVAGFLDNSTVNGPGIRSVIFLAGCNHGCGGCQNKSIQDYTAGTLMSTNQIFLKVGSNKPFIQGVTFSGGEPFDQDFAKLAKQFKQNNLDVWVYTGYTLEELLADEREYIREAFKYIDVIVDGKFETANTHNAPKYAGSSNQRFIFLHKGEVIEVASQYK